MRRSMRFFVPTALAIASARTGVAQGEQQAPLRVAASSFATVEVHINSRRIGMRWYGEDASLAGPTRIAISYAQPHARGRKVEGGLIPLDTVWRFGANAATTLHADVDMKLGDLQVPRGDDSLHVLYQTSGWTLIVNRQTGNWGSDYDPTRDFGRTKLASRALAETEDALSVYLVPESGRPSTGYAELRGVLRFKWAACSD